MGKEHAVNEKEDARPTARFGATMTGTREKRRKSPRNGALK